MKTIAFTVSAKTSSDFDTQMGGWRCPALRIPGAKLDAVYADGKTLPPDDYRVDAGNGIVRWTKGRSRPPADITFSFLLSQRLVRLSVAIVPSVILGIATIVASIIPFLFPCEEPPNDQVTSNVISPELIRLVYAIDGVLAEHVDSDVKWWLTKDEVNAEATVSAIGLQNVTSNQCYPIFDLLPVNLEFVVFRGDTQIDDLSFLRRKNIRTLSFEDRSQLSASAQIQLREETLEELSLDHSNMEDQFLHNVLTQDDGTLTPLARSLRILHASPKMSDASVSVIEKLEVLHTLMWNPNGMSKNAMRELHIAKPGLKILHHVSGQEVEFENDNLVVENRRFRVELASAAQASSQIVCTFKVQPKTDIGKFELWSGNSASIAWFPDHPELPSVDYSINGDDSRVATLLRDIPLTFSLTFDGCPAGTAIIPRVRVNSDGLGQLDFTNIPVSHD